MTDELDLRAQARIGHVLNDKWRLERLLGVGGMAAVYAARHRNGAKAAVKVLHAELGADPDVKQRFLHEGYAANKVEHPNAVQVLDDDQVTSGAPGDAGTAYLVMELLDGESLLEHARKEGKALPDSEVLTIADQVLDVLDAAHRHGIVHRDLKPENLFMVKSTGDSLPAAGLAAMLAPPIRVKVLDFGIARIADGGGKTRVGTALGTPTYMAPEQASGRRDEIDGRTDLFALGATMWRLLTGKRIHDAPSSAEILAKMATVPAPPILSVAPHLSPGLAQIIDCSLRFRMGDRYPDAKTMRDDVRAVLEGRPPPYASTYAAASELKTAAALPVARAQSSFSAGGSEATGLPPVAELKTAAARPPRTDVLAAELPRTNDHGQDQSPPAPIPPTTGYAPITAPMIGAAAAPASPARKRNTGLVAGLLLLVVVGLGVGAFVIFSSPSKATSTEGKVEEAKAKPSADDDDDKTAGKDEDDDEAKTKPKPSAADDSTGDDDGAGDDEPPGFGSGGPNSHGNATAIPISPTTKPTTKPKTTTTATTAKPKSTSTATTIGTSTQAPPTLTVAPTTTTPPPPPPPPVIGLPPSASAQKGKGNGGNKGKKGND